MIKGICHWFYRVNENDRNGLRYCRHGSTCRYRHLTQEEVQQITERGNEQHDCPSCKGTGEVFMRNLGFHMTCFHCNGRRQTSIKKDILSKTEKREWCRCKNTDVQNTFYYPDGQHPKCSKHCYVCQRCKGITQVG